MLNSIRAKNSVFSAAALPVSANTQGAYLNQVFIGMFRPDGNALPRWVGNLKQYQFKYDATLDTLELADALNNSAVIADTGFINPVAESYWTKDSTFWTGDPTKYPNPSDRPDGEVVEKGGIGQWLRTAYSSSTARAGRPVYTCVGNSCNDADLASKPEYAFKPGNTLLTNTVFAGADKTLLINWILGDENVLATNVANFTAARDQLTTPPSGSTVRPSIHGDVLHSRPIALNYAGASETPNVYVFYGANDGMLRAINGNRTGSAAGSELWAFVAEEHFPTLKRLRENNPEVKYPSTPVSNTTAQPRSYFFDGPIGAYQNPGASEVKIFATMRRGGRAVYAFDVKDPLKPRVMWRINESLSDYASMGWTWSTPRPALVKGYSDPVLIMGGGYDSSEDKSDPGTLGRGVYVIDMKTGQRLAHLFVAADPGFSVPSDVALIDSDRDGYVDRGYFVDVRANVYRIDMEYDAGSPSVGQKREPKDWKVTKIAALNDGDNGVSGTRRVFFAPDVVLTKDYTALMIGTGDREKPLTVDTNDRFFIIKDSKVTKGEPPSTPTAIKEGDLVAVGTDGENGCFLTFSEAKLGEKVINQPITFAGITYFSTNRPVLRSENAKACSATRSRAYQVPLICRAPPEPIALSGDGLPPSPVVGYVEVGNGKVVPFVIGGANTKKSAIEVTRPQISIPGNRKRSYWFMQNQDR
jgi:type IV pilus assembly protein PilY1